MTQAESVTEAHRCHHCGREVGETRHTRSSYKVDHYTLYTGEVEPVTRVRGDDTDEVITVLKLVRPMVFTTCADCYRRPEVRSERDQLFQPEVAAEKNGEQSSVIRSQ
jgi:hypothetical protein